MEAEVVVVVAAVEVMAAVTTVMPATVPALDVGTVGVVTVKTEHMITMQQRQHCGAHSSGVKGERGGAGAESI